MRMDEEVPSSSLAAPCPLASCLNRGPPSSLCHPGATALETLRACLGASWLSLSSGLASTCTPRKHSPGQRCHSTVGGPPGKALWNPASRPWPLPGMPSSISLRLSPTGPRFEVEPPSRPLPKHPETEVMGQAGALPMTGGGNPSSGGDLRPILRPSILWRLGFPRPLWATGRSGSSTVGSASTLSMGTGGQWPLRQQGCGGRDGR